jgi:alanine racemase
MRTQEDASRAGAILTIDLGAVRANYRMLRDRLGGAQCAAVVKANAYGLGADRVAAALRREGCDTFFVAHPSEGLSLRASLGPRPTIFVLNGLHPGAEQAAAAAAIVPVLNSLGQIARWQAEAARLGRRLPAALQVDSGMARIGLPPIEVETLAREPGLLDNIDTVLVMSHLARADEPAETANEAQRAGFERLAAMLPPAPRSLANCSGIFLGPAFRFDLARPGAALYGINPTPAAPNPMRPVVTLQARVIQTRDVPAGSGIGYGHVDVASAPMRLATISLGYADGWHRRGAAAAFAHGQRLPFIGRVSMDSIILDVSSLPPHLPAEGELVELIGGAQDVDAVAALSGTIGYEVLTSLGTRFHRIYLDD